MTSDPAGREQMTGHRDGIVISGRREFLKDLAEATVGILFVGCGLTGALAAAQQTRKRREVVVGGRRALTVDVHCHCYIREVWDLIKDYDQAKASKRQADTAEGQKLNLTTLQSRLQQMDEQGIDIQAVSLSTPQYHYWAERDLARQIVRVQNEKIAELCAAHPDRFVGMGAVALHYPDLAAEQTEYAIKKLGMRGIQITGSVNGEELSSPKFHPFWAKVEELGILIFIHPAGFPEGEKRFQGNGRLDNVIANPLETTVALSHLIFEGTLDRFPGLKICAAHGGGFLASYIGRSDHCIEFDPGCKPVKKRPSEYLKQLYFDSLLYTAEGLRHLIAEAGADRIVLGTDFPFMMGESDAVNHILSLPGLSDASRVAMLGGIAAKLLQIHL